MDSKLRLLGADFDSDDIIERGALSKFIKHVLKALKNTHCGGRDFDATLSVGEVLEGMIEVETVLNDFSWLYLSAGDE